MCCNHGPQRMRTSGAVYPQPRSTLCAGGGRRTLEAIVRSDADEGDVCSGPDTPERQ